MAFEQNQQDELNLGTGFDQVRQFQAELDKATASIGAAELAAEEEQLGVKLRNLETVQRTRLRQLDQLVAMEEASIQELARLKLTLSKQQFAVRKNEIQREFQLAKDAAEALYRVENSKKTTKGTSTTNKPIKQSSIATDITATAAKQSTKVVNSTDTKSAMLELNKTLRFIDGKLSGIQSSVRDIRRQIEADLQARAGMQQQLVQSVQNSTSVDQPRLSTPDAAVEADQSKLLQNVATSIQQPIPEPNITVEPTPITIEPTPVIVETTQVQEATPPNVAVEPTPVTVEPTIAVTPEITVEPAPVMVEQAQVAAPTPVEVLPAPVIVEPTPVTVTPTITVEPTPAVIEQQQQTDNSTEFTSSLALALNETGGEITNISGYLDSTNRFLNQITINTSRAATLLQQSLVKADSSESNIEALVNAQASQVAATAESKESVTAITHSGPPVPPTSDVAKPEANVPEKREYSDDNNGLKSVELGQHSFSSIKETFDDLKNSLANTAISIDLDNIIKSEGKENQASQTSIDLAGELLDGIIAANAAEASLAEFKKDAETLALNRRLIMAKEEQDQLRAIRRKELELLEANASAEATIAFNRANRAELLAQEEQRVKLKYLQEYQELQMDGFSELVENMSEEMYVELRKKSDEANKKIAKRKRVQEARDKAIDTIKGPGTIGEKLAMLTEQIATRAAETGRGVATTATSMALGAATEKLADIAQQLNSQTDKIGAKQAPIDTRLQGSTANDKILGSYWKQLARDMNKIGAVNPYFKQEDFANNIEALVNRGISFDIKQRAFLMTIQEKIANTFEVADGTLLRLIRIQQQDTTAGRLGMESALNSFLNSMYETSEYLTDVASSVRGSLEEMQALMEGAAGTELEFQVQKWMGSLYSVGMSQNAVQSIAQTFGQIASGDVSGLTGSGTGNLLIMAANEAGMSIADILQDGLNADDTNKLMQAMVNYLAEIAETSSDSRVVQQQLANVYGIKASDLKAATNLASSIKDVSNQDLTYSGMLGQLNKMANSMLLRTSTGEMLSNIWDNAQYTMATQMANDPILYLLPRVATLLEDYAGGIDLPFLNVMGFGVDLNTSVAQLMNVASMSGSILGALGPAISGLTSAVSGSVMLSKAGIDTTGKTPVIARGSAPVLQNLGGSSITESGYIGNASGDDVKNATLQDAEDSKKKQLIEARDEESADDVVLRSQQAVIDIYNLLEEVAHGSQSLRVRLVNNNGGNQVYGQQQENETPTAPGILGGDNGNWVLSF